jgi:hypothetical protein
MAGSCQHTPALLVDTVRTVIAGYQGLFSYTQSHDQHTAAHTQSITELQQIPEITLDMMYEWRHAALQAKGWRLDIAAIQCVQGDRNTSTFPPISSYAVKARYQRQKIPSA